MHRKPLTARQRELLNYLYEHTLVRGYQPSMRDICQTFGLTSTNGVVDHLKLIEKKGYIEFRTGRSRGIRLLDWTTRLRRYALHLEAREKN